MTRKTLSLMLVDLSVLEIDLPGPDSPSLPRDAGGRLHRSYAELFVETCLSLIHSLGGER